MVSLSYSSMLSSTEGESAYRHGEHQNSKKIYSFSAKATLCHHAVSNTNFLLLYEVFLCGFFSFPNVDKLTSIEESLTKMANNNEEATYCRKATRQFLPWGSILPRIKPLVNAFRNSLSYNIPLAFLLIEVVPSENFGLLMGQNLNTQFCNLFNPKAHSQRFPYRSLQRGSE
jgi:hypothetical protein